MHISRRIPGGRRGVPCRGPRHPGHRRPMKPKTSALVDDSPALQVVLIGADALPTGWVSETIAALTWSEIRLIAPDARSVYQVCADPAVGVVVLVRHGVPASEALAIERTLRERGGHLAVISVADGAWDESASGPDALRHQTEIR